MMGISMERFFILAALLMAASAPAADRKILVYTRNYTPNGKGFVHDNIAASVAAIRKMGAGAGFAVDVSDSPDVFTAAALRQYRAIVFSNSNNEAFATDAQRNAFQQYIQAGGGFVGIHSASGSERKWPWFWSMLGGTFNRHPKLQPFTVRVCQPDFAAMGKLPASFEWADECYYFHHLNPDIRVLLSADPSKIADPKKQSDPPELVDSAIPLAWYHTFDGGREFYTALGHKKEDYTNPLLYNQILGGIIWAMGDAK
jgi:type 1 glutamine amidotransferase